MTARYRLLKGNACDFVGAPANASLAIRHRMDGRLAWCEKLETHATMWEPGKKNTYFIGNKENWFLVGIREPATNDEQDINECIGRHNWREKVGELYMDGKPHTAHLDGTNCRCKPSDMTIQGIPINEISGTETVTYNKYLREIKPGVWVDIYDVLMAWGVTNPALQHLIKKALQAGDRGHKSREQDLQDIIDSAIRAKELEIK